VPLPIARMDREPEGDEALLFDVVPASEWNEHWVGVDGPKAARKAEAVLKALKGWGRLVTPLG